MIKIPFVLLFGLFLCGLTNLSFSQKGNYEQVAEFQPPHIDFTRNSNDRKYQLNALKLSESGKILLADYGNKSSLIAVYNLDSLKFMGAYWIDNIIELDHCYFSDNDTRLYVKASRFSSDYKVINLETKTIRDLGCDKTPRGCVATTATLNVIKLYSPDRKYYFVRNANDKRTLHIYKRAGE
jgi:hypothetical protein